jgi:hypothetical protein
MPRVTAQGKTFNFPDGTTPEQMGLAIDEYFAQAAEPQKGDLTAEQFQEQFGDVPDIEGRIAEPEPKPEASLADQAIGAGEAALATLSGATTGTAGMVTGTIDQLIKEIRSGEFGSNEAANRIANRAAELQASTTYQPRTEEGAQALETVGEVGEAFAPLAGLGGSVAQATQLASRATPQARAAILNSPSSASAARAIAEISKEPGEIAKAVFSYQSPVKQRIGRLIEDGVADVETARFSIDKPSPKVQPRSRLAKALGAGAPKIKADKIAIEAIDQGFDEGVVATIKGAIPTDKNAMRKMLGIYERGKKNAEFRAKNRPTDIVGDRIVDTVNIVKRANKKAGAEINKAAEALRGRYVESQPIGDRFIEALTDAGVNIGDDLKLSFKGSDFEDLPAVERTINTVFRRMSGPKRPDAYEMHRMKRFIDEQVTYGKGGEGLTGRSESMLKALRRDIDDVLDENLPEYNEANTIYSETIGALDDIQDVAGRKIDLDGKNANKALGTLMRRVLGNAQSRVNVIDAVDGIEKMAEKYPGILLLEGPGGTKKKPSITQLIMFADELDSRFGPAARTSFQGQIEQVAQRGRNIAQAQSPTMAAADVAVGAAARGLDKIKGVSDEKALAALKKLLNEEK